MRKFAVVLGLALLAGIGILVLRPSAEATARDPREVLGRVWFDRYPKTRSEEIKLWIFLPGGLGIYETGSVWRATTDVFDFERQGSSLDLTFLHDKKKAKTAFEIERCDEAPPFDLCLTLKDPPNGPKRYYGFSYDDDMDAKVPWGRGMLKAAQSRAGAAR